MALSKANDLLHRFVWSSANRTANNIVEMAARSPASAIKSASRFDGANEIAVKTTIQLNLIALSYKTFSLGHLLIYPSLVAVITIVCGDRDGGDGDDRDAVRRGA